MQYFFRHIRNACKCCNQVHNFFINSPLAFHDNSSSLAIDRLEVVMTKYLRFLCSVVLVLTISVVSFGDTIRLKDGSILKGKITAFTGGKFSITIGEGSRSRQMTFFANEIDSITFDQLPSTTAVATNPTKNASYTPPSSPPKVVISNNDDIEPVVVQTPKQKPTTITKPIEWNIRVLADNTSNGWTNTGWVVKKGQRIRISGDGTISLGGGKSSPPSGVAELNDTNKLLKNVPTGALIAVIGDDNNDFIYIGTTREIVATRDGALFLGINEGNLDDNRGSYDVKVEVSPENGS